MDSYIQYAEGYSKENVTKDDIRKAIQDIQNMDVEHNAFWVSVIIETENVIEVDNSLAISLILEPTTDTEYKYKARDWLEVEKLYFLLLDRQFDEIWRLIK